MPVVAINLLELYSVRKTLSLFGRRLCGAIAGMDAVNKGKFFTTVANRTPIYRVSQEECARLREGVPYVKVYRYNPKHLCPNLNGYRDNGQRKVWSSGGSTHCTCQLTAYSKLRRWLWYHMTAIQLTLAINCYVLPSGWWRSYPCYVSAGAFVSCIVLGTLRTTMTWVRVFL